MHPIIVIIASIVVLIVNNHCLAKFAQYEKSKIKYLWTGLIALCESVNLISIVAIISYSLLITCLVLANNIENPIYIEWLCRFHGSAIYLTDTIKPYVNTIYIFCSILTLCLWFSLFIERKNKIIMVAEAYAKKVHIEELKHLKTRLLSQDKSSNMKYKIEHIDNEINFIENKISNAIKLYENEINQTVFHRILAIKPFLDSLRKSRKPLESIILGLIFISIVGSEASNLEGATRIAILKLKLQSNKASLLSNVSYRRSENPFDEYGSLEDYSNDLHDDTKELICKAANIIQQTMEFNFDITIKEWPSVRIYSYDSEDDQQDKKDKNYFRVQRPPWFKHRSDNGIDSVYDINILLKNRLSKRVQINEKIGKETLQKLIDKVSSEGIVYYDSKINFLDDIIDAVSGNTLENYFEYIAGDGIIGKVCKMISLDIINTVIRESILQKTDKVLDSIARGNDYETILSVLKSKNLIDSLGEEGSNYFIKKATEARDKLNREIIAEHLRKKEEERLERERVAEQRRIEEEIRLERERVAEQQGELTYLKRKYGNSVVVVASDEQGNKLYFLGNKYDGLNYGYLGKRYKGREKSNGSIVLDTCPYVTHPNW